MNTKDKLKELKAAHDTSLVAYIAASEDYLTARKNCDATSEYCDDCCSAAREDYLNAREAREAAWDIYIDACEDTK